MIAAAEGYQCLVTVPAKTSSEKIRTMELFGAEVRVSPQGVSVNSPEHDVNRARRLAETLPGAVLLNQYQSQDQDNIDAHYDGTDPKIWEDMDGRVDYLVAAASFGGTVRGIARYLKERNPDIQVIMHDPKGSAFFDYFHTGKPDAVSSYRIEGAGKDGICPIHDFSLIDRVESFTDEEAFALVQRLACQEGLLVGGCAGGVLAVINKLNNNIRPASRAVEETI